MTQATTTTNAAHRQGSAHVIARGASGRLFYESYANEFTDIANTAKDPLFLLPDAIRWKKLLETRGRLLKQRGLRLYILIAPDAHFIYRDEVPPHIVLPSRSPAQQFTDLFSGIDNVTIINPEKALVAARGGIDVYKVNDTHWSAHGAFVAYRCLLDALPPGIPMHPLTAADVSYKPHRSFGDLGALVDPEVTVDIPVASVRGGNCRSAHEYAGEGRNAWKRFESSRGRGHAFIPRDSFATELGIFCNETFARVDWVGGTSRLHLEAIDEEKPDVVIWQVAERRLFHVEHDHHAKTAYEIYAFDRSTPFTDWVNVGKALPEFVGHCQPRIPGELGYYDLRLKEVQRRQSELARQHGIHGFCYYYYWFNGVRLLDTPLRTMLDDAHNDFPFCLCWANENWTRRWDGLDHEVLVAQSHSPDDDLAFIAELAPYLRDRRYIRIDGRPLIVVYRPSLLPDAKATAERWRTYCRDRGIGEIFLATTQAFERTNPTYAGFDAAIEFAPNNIAQRDMRHAVELVDPAFAGQVFDYRALIERSFRHTPPSYPLFRSVCPGWDNTARRPGRGTVFAHASPAGYQEWLEQVCAYTLQHFEGDARLVFINAWNEWAEGAYLEPDRRTGYALLNATTKALRNATQSRPARPPNVAVIAHVYYEELWPEISSRLRAWDVPFALHVTTPHDGFADVVKADWPDAIVACVPNRGRDMAAFLQQARIAVDGGADLVCKVHTKRSTHRTDGEQWRRDLYGKVLGDRHSVRCILQVFAQNAALGIVAPEGHVVAGEYYWGSNADRVRNLAARIGYPGDPTPFVFAAGSMFWARSEALQPILDLDLETADFEEEEGQLDGTLAHALERLFPIAAKLGGYRLADTRIVGKPQCRANELRSQRELAVFGDAAREYPHATSSRPVPPG